MDNDIFSSTKLHGSNDVTLHNSSNTSTTDALANSETLLLSETEQLTPIEPIYKKNIVKTPESVNNSDNPVLNNAISETTNGIVISNGNDDDDIVENGINGEDDNRTTVDDVYHEGNPALNKSFDVLPLLKKEDEYVNVLDTTVELPDREQLEPEVSDEFVTLSPTSTTTLDRTMEVKNEIRSPGHERLSSKVSVEYPLVQDSHDPPNELVNGLSNMTLQSKPVENTPPVSDIKPAFDTNTFVLKKKERRKVNNENSLNLGADDSMSEFPDLCNKGSPLTLHTMSNEQPPPALDDAQRKEFIDCLESYYRTLWNVCAHTEELKRELRMVKSERDQLTEDLVNVENAYADLRKRNEKLKLNITEHKKNVETLKQFSEESIRYTEEQKQKYQVLKQHAQEKLDKANEEIEKLRRTNATESEGAQAQLRYAQLRVQSLEQELQSIKQELQQKKKENTELTNICDELLATNRR